MNPSYLIMFLIFSEWENLIEVSALQQKYYRKTEKKNKNKVFCFVYYYYFFDCCRQSRVSRARVQ